jgi:hypothetical protein
MITVDQVMENHDHPGFEHFPLEMADIDGHRRSRERERFAISDVS